MGITLEFYSADAEKLVARVLEDEYLSSTYIAQQQIPLADFTFHLMYPDDLNSLCEALRKQKFVIPPNFEELITEQLWDDGESAVLSLVSRSFAVIWAQMKDDVLEQVARDWACTFNYQEPLHDTPAYKALIQLRAVAQDVILNNRSLILFLLI